MRPLRSKLAVPLAADIGTGDADDFVMNDIARREIDRDAAAGAPGLPACPDAGWARSGPAVVRSIVTSAVRKLAAMALHVGADRDRTGEDSLQPDIRAPGAAGVGHQALDGQAGW